MKGELFMTAKIHVMHTGSVYIDQALAFREKSWHPAPYTGWFRPERKKMWVPVSTYLIEHPKGRILIDTGWHEDIRNNQKRHLGFLAASMFTGKLPEGQAIHEQLMSKGMSDRDLDYVILTHLHSDHVSGLKHVDRARKILVSPLELAAASKAAGYVPSMWKGVNLETVQLQEIPYGPYRLGNDVFGDGTVYLVHTPGHSKGQLSVMVLTQKGWVLLAADVGYASVSWERQILPGITVNDREANESLTWVSAFAKSEDCATVLANHDPAVYPHIIG
jgi:N-acyl homoserine lactone hydrolase